MHVHAADGGQHPGDPAEDPGFGASSCRGKARAPWRWWGRRPMSPSTSATPWPSLIWWPARTPPDRHDRAGAQDRWTARRRGELLFNDATLCYQRWQSCASCHPDARADALNWDLMNDGVGNPKTPRACTGPSNPAGDGRGVRRRPKRPCGRAEHILFADRPEEEAAAIDEYLKSLKPVPSPYLVDGQLSPAAQRGKKLFESDRIGCDRLPPRADLHRPEDARRGYARPGRFVDRFDTPTLVEVWRTAPYLHDGRYATIKELIVQGKHGQVDGRAADLNRQQVDDLIEFVLSL